MRHIIRHYLLKYKYVIALAIFLIAIGLVGDHCWIKRIEQSKEIAQLKSEIEKEIKTFNDDKEQLEKLKTNPEAVKRIAHERYYMKTEAEDIFVIEDE